MSEPRASAESFTNHANVQAASLLRAVAGANARLDALGRALEDRTDVIRVDHEFECFGDSDDFPTAPIGVLSWWIETNYRDGSSRCLTLDLFYDGQSWVVRTGVTKPGRDGPDPLVAFPDRNADTIPDCVRELTSAVDGSSEMTSRF